MPDVVEIGRRIKRWLHEADLTQKQLAQRLNTSQSQVSRAVCARLDPASDVLNSVFTYVQTHSATTGGAEPPGPELGTRALPAAIADAAYAVWDGSPEDAERVAGLLRAAGALRGTPRVARG